MVIVPRITTLFKISCLQFYFGEVYIPDRAIEGYNSEDIPVAGNPAPKGGISIHVSFLFCGNKEVDQCRDEGQAIAAEEIPLLQMSELLSTKLVVECEENIQSHGEGPVSISWHEPRKVSEWACSIRRLLTSGSRKLGIDIMHHCNAQFEQLFGP
jgi:hypothetical protein